MQTNGATSLAPPGHTLFLTVPFMIRQAQVSFINNDIDIRITPDFAPIDSAGLGGKLDC